ncbi:EamA family transporter [Rothia sp. CCM 9418]|uniref:EamA family transporter n=1 Tax=unclassified Rothia (in: high G+C Gram-positive bacteria) TaxID=2689056 RepID=UPI003ABF4DBF
MAKFTVDALAAKIPSEHRGTAALALVMLGSISLQVSTAFASDLFQQFTPIAVTGMRMAVAAVILFLIVRPNPFALKASDWPQVLLYGLVVSLMTGSFYMAVSYIPLGIAVTVEYLGAFAISLLGVKRIRDSFISLGALIGVALIAGPTFESSHLIGYLFAVMSATCMGGYTFLSAHLGTKGSPAVSGLKGLSLSICFSALLLTPWSAPSFPRVDFNGWFLLVMVGFLGVVVTYSFDAIAGRITSPAVIGVLFSLDPVNGAIIGTLLLGQVLSIWSYVGIVLIACSGALLVWQTNKSAIKISANTAILDVVVSTRTQQLPIISKDLK